MLFSLSNQPLRISNSLSMSTLQLISYILLLYLVLFGKAFDSTGLSIVKSPEQAASV